VKAGPPSPLRAALLAALWAGLAMPAPAQDLAPPGPAIRRVANLSDGAPAFDVLDANGQRVRRIECIADGWYDADAMAVRLMGSPGVMAAILAKGEGLTIEDLGPAIFNCIVVPPPAAASLWRPSP
jgi:hypothetical protein